MRDEPRRASWLDLFRGSAAVAVLTMREATRQRLWWLVLVAMCGLLLVVPNLQAVDDAARLKLAVSAVSGVIGFITTLVSVFLVAVSVRRDLESRSSFLLFSKPLPRLGYCLGRWGGTMLTLTLVVLLLSLAGALAIRVQLGSVPNPQRLLAPQEWLSVDSLGGTQAPHRDYQRLQLGQRSGSGVRLQFSGLDPQRDDQVLLLKGTVRSGDGVSGFSYVPLQVAALSGGDGRGHSPRQLSLSEDSPLGRHEPGGEVVAEGQVVLRHRGPQRNDLNNDFIRFQIEPRHINADGTLHVQVLRTSSEGFVAFERRGSFWVSSDGPPFWWDLTKASLVQLAHAGVLAAAALLLVIVAGIGTALLGCLTLFFGGHAVGVMSDMASSSQTSLFARRLVDLIVPIIPDFSYFPVAAQLASSQMISLSAITQAWGYFAVWMLAFLGIAWLILWRKEL